jgi:hypothetical protein
MSTNTALSKSNIKSSLKPKRRVSKARFLQEFAHMEDGYK